MSFQTADDLAVVHGGLRHKGGVGVQDGNPFQPPSGWNVAPTKGPTKQIKVGVAESRQSAVTDQLHATHAGENIVGKHGSETGATVAHIAWQIARLRCAFKSNSA